MRGSIATTVAAILIGMALPAAAQTPAPATPLEVDYRQIPLTLPDGARVRQVITKTTRTEQDGRIETGRFEGEYLNSFTPDKDGYRVTKTRVKSTFALSENIPSEGETHVADLKKMMDALSDIPEITYVADINLTPLRIENWPKLRGQIKKAMRGAGLMKARQEEAFDSLYDRVTPEGAAELFLPEDAMLSIPHNLGLSLNNPYRLDSKMPGPFGGDPLDARESLTLTLWDEAAQTAQITYESGPTREAMDAYAIAIKPVLEQIAQDEAKLTGTAPKAVGDVHLDIATRCLYEVSLKTGLVSRAECNSRRDVRVGDERQSQQEDWAMREELVP